MAGDPRFGGPQNGTGGMAVHIGPINTFPRDRFGVPIRPGQHVLYRPEIDVVYQVLDVKPILDPRMPTGSVQLVLTVTMPLVLGTQQPIGRLIAIGTPPEVEVTDAEPEKEPS